MELTEEAMATVANMDQTQLAESIAGKIPYDMQRDILIKELPPIMLKQKVKKPVIKEVADEEGLPINEYDSFTEEEQEVPSNFRTGIILKLPKDVTQYTVGMTILYNFRSTMSFDLLPDAKLIRPYDILAIVEV